MTDQPCLPVVFMLSYERVVPQEPKEPGFFDENKYEWPSQEDYCSNNAMTITILEARM